MKCVRATIVAVEKQ